MDSKKSAGFSLWDAIAIVGIVVIVAAILWPAFCSHTCSARKAPCASNLKQIGTALNMYFSEYDAVMPSSYLYGRSKTWNRSDFVHFAADRGTLPPPKGAKSGYTWTMILYPYMRTKAKDIMWCPSDPDSGSTREDATVSYYFKAAADRAWYEGDKREADFEYPQDQIIFYERRSFHWGSADALLANGDSLNMLYLDGHTGTRKIKDSGGPDDSPAPPRGEPAWYNWNGVTGEGVGLGRYYNPHDYCDCLP